MSFVPYVGSLIALVLSIAVSLVQGWPSLKLFFMALAVVVAGQFLEGNVISPKLVGGSVGLHPVWLMFALLAFGQLFGFVGLVIAVPAAAAIGVVVRHLIGLYLKSPFYLGRAATRNHDRAAPADARLAASAELCGRGLSSRAFEPRGARRDQPMAGLAEPHAAPGRSGGVGKKPSRGALGAEVRRDRVCSADRLGEADIAACAERPAILIEDADRIGDGRGAALPYRQRRPAKRALDAA